MAKKPYEGRDADHAGHHQQHHRRKPRAAGIQAAEVIQLFGLEATPRQQQNHAERGGRHDAVHDGVKQRGFLTFLRIDSETGQHETDMTNRRIRQACA